MTFELTGTRADNRKRKFSFFANPLLKDKKEKEQSALIFLSGFLYPASFSTFASRAFLFVEKFTKKSRMPFGKLAKELNSARKTKTPAKIILNTASNTAIILLILFSSCSDNFNDLKIIFAGDLMLDRGVKQSIINNGIDYLFEDVKGILSSSDASIINFESSSNNGALEPVNKKFTFNTNPEWLSALSKIGVNYVSLANNHSLDFGETGIKQTIANLNKAGITYMGYNGEKDFCEPTIIESKGNKIAVFSSTFLRQEGATICNYNASLLSEKIKTFKVLNPSSLIFVSLHWGTEFKDTPDIQQTEQAHLLIDAGADMVIGHHPHVVQTIESYKGKFIFYSIGNFIFDSSHPPSNKGILVELSISKNNLKETQIIPFNIIKSKPVLMNSQDSNTYMEQLSLTSPSVVLKQKGNNWQISSI